MKTKNIGPHILKAKTKLYKYCYSYNISTRDPKYLVGKHESTNLKQPSKS